MKIKFIYIKFTKLIYIILFIILIIIFYFFIFIQCKNIDHEKTSLSTNVIAVSSNINSIPNSTNSTSKITNNLDEKNKIQMKNSTRILPEKLENFEILGMITIPKLNLKNYILAESSTKALNISVIKLCGPNINEIGNFCIAGHNYKKMFKEIKILKKNDQIILTDIYGSTTFYQIYANYETSPQDISCLNQNTEGEREITLITCTPGAINRVIIKAAEIYD